MTRFTPNIRVERWLLRRDMNDNMFRQGHITMPQRHDGQGLLRRHTIGQLRYHDNGGNVCYEMNGATVLLLASRWRIYVTRYAAIRYCYEMATRIAWRADIMALVVCCYRANTSATHRCRQCYVDIRWSRVITAR